jgi:phosphoribosylanthranilate isomerase
MFVKVCGLREERHVRDAVEAGADAIGFVFADSVRRVTPAEAAAISAGVPETVKRVAVMLHPTNDEWQAVLAGFAPDVLQTDAEDFAALDVPDSVERWPVYRQGNKVTDTFRPSIKVSVTLIPTYLYEGARSGAGEAIDWTMAAEVARRGNMILAGGLSAENVAEAIATVRPFGVDASSAVESSRGVKDSQKIRDFIRAAKAAGKEV